MKYISDPEDLRNAELFMNKAALMATKSLCLRAKCGAVIVNYNSVIIGEGYNAPPLDKIENRKCELSFNIMSKPKYDKTCCVHAEQRAIINALKRFPSPIIGKESKLYFVRVDDKGSILFSGKPYCTVCSRLTLDAGIGSFLLWHEDGICEYESKEYNDLSYTYYI